MINYSNVKRSVNANLLEINQAKARIKEAKAKGETPKQADVELVNTEVQKTFAVAQYSEVMTIEKFAKHISSHGCVYSRADISAILYMAVDCMREQLLEGKKIRLGDLGDFAVSLSSKGAADASTFTAQNITDVKVFWEPGAQFKNLITDAEFNLVASRAAQAKVLKALRAGESKVDLEGADNGDNGDNGGNAPGGNKPGGNPGSGSNPSGGSSTGGGNTEGGNTEGGGTTEGGGSGSDDGHVNI